MLLPESMSRIVIVGTKARLEDAVNALYSEKAIHVIDHTTGDDGLSIGTSLETTSKASERLLKVRALESLLIPQEIIPFAKFLSDFLHMSYLRISFFNVELATVGCKIFILVFTRCNPC